MGKQHQQREKNVRTPTFNAHIVGNKSWPDPEPSGKLLHQCAIKWVNKAHCTAGQGLKLLPPPPGPTNNWLFPKLPAAQLQTICSTHPCATAQWLKIAVLDIRRTVTNKLKTEVVFFPFLRKPQSSLCSISVINVIWIFLTRQIQSAYLSLL